MKTLQQLWDETPSGQAITDPAYQYLCQWIEEKRIPLNMHQLGYRIPGFWNMNCEEALQAIVNWLKAESIRAGITQAEFLEKLRIEYQEAIFGK